MYYWYWIANFVFSVYILGMKVRSRSYSASSVVAAVRGYKAGYSQRKIAFILNIPRTTIREWIHDHMNKKVRMRNYEHPHRWKIESPNGPTSLGLCMVCFQKKEFPNSIEKSVWG